MSIERFWSRLANYSRQSGRIFAILRRTAWGERTVSPRFDRNSIDFEGWIVSNGTPVFDSAHLVKIGFFHPIYNGAATRGQIVEVFHNPYTASPCKYVARGVGLQILYVGPHCDNITEAADPCAPATCDSWRFVWGYAGTSAYDPMRYGLFNAEDRTYVPFINEMPALLYVPGYGGARELPVPFMPMMMDWVPGIGAFTPNFQRCLPIGAGANSYTDFCCTFRQFLIENFGQEAYDLEFSNNTEFWLWCQGFWDALHGGWGAQAPL